MLFPFLDYRPRVAVLRLAGVLSGRPGAFGSALSLGSVAPLLERAFALPNLKAVFLVINSPGGSPVQSSLIAGRIRTLAVEKKVPVVACVEDAAASGGYWLACAADEIVTDPSSIVGSIGVIAAGFGFAEALGKLGIERRVRTAGSEKSFWDPFRPEDPADAARLRTLLDETHEEFRAWVRARRGDRLRANEEEVFSGRFWTGRRAVELGLADRLGADPVAEAKRRFGDRVRVVPVGARRLPIWRRLAPGLSAEAALTEMEQRAAWARLGL
jgi:signal peptide peptidase SppA